VRVVSSFLDAFQGCWPGYPFRHRIGRWNPAAGPAVLLKCTALFSVTGDMIMDDCVPRRK
jgi:hypothetical protein